MCAKQPEVDEDGYPTEATTVALELWDWRDLTGALDFLKAAWHWPDMASHDISAHEGYVLHAEPNQKYLRLATGGWSGNEDLVGAFQQNTMAWLLSWRLSAQGGLHIFQYPEERQA